MKMLEMDEWILSQPLWIRCVLVVLAALVIHALVMRLLARWSSQNESNSWFKGLIQAIRPPLLTLIWILALAFVAEQLMMFYQISGRSWIAPIQRLSWLLTTTWFLFRLSYQLQNWLIQVNPFSAPIDEHTALALGKLARAVFLMIMLLTILPSMGVSISGILAFGGLGGIAIGFAAKDMLANLFGGLLIYLDSPFKVGDWVRSSDREIEGTVENIGWRMTRIRTFDKRPLYIPNAVFSNIAVENPSRMTHRRIYERFTIRLDDVRKSKKIINEIKEMLRTHDEIDDTQTLIVNINHFANSGIEFFVYSFTKTTNWVYFHEVKQDVLLRILGIITAHGAHLCYATQRLLLEGESPKPASFERPESE